jgi:effector-binding domain-containing protein
LQAHLWITFQIAKKEFRFYSAKAYFIILLRQDDDYKKIRYFNYGLNSYNTYLQRRLKFEIGDIEKAYSRFIYADTTEKQEITNSVCESLEDNDRLKLARYLATISKIPEAELFVSVSLLQKLKTIGAFLATAITLIVSIIALYRP